jgi:hypothetical protein
MSETQTENSLQIIETTIKAQLDSFVLPIEAKITELREKSKLLAIVDINDKKGYDEVVVFIRECRTLRTSTDKETAIIKRPMLDANKWVEEKRKYVITSVSEVEDQAQALKDSIDAEKEKIKAEKKEKQEAVLRERTAVLNTMDVTFDGVNFVLGDVSFERAVIMDADEDIYQDKIFARYKKVFDENEVIRIENEKLEAQRLLDEKKKQDDLAAKQAEIDKKEKELESQKLQLAKDKKAADKKLFSERLAQLKDTRYNGIAVLYQDKMIASEIELIEMDGDSFESLKEKHNKLVDENNAVAAQKAADELAESNRKAAEKAQQELLDKIAKENQEKADKEAADKLAAQEKAENESDKVKWDLYVKQLLEVNKPNLTGRHFSKKMGIAIEKLGEIKQL